MKIDINDNILSLIGKTPDLLISGIAQRVKQRRLEKDWTQKTFATKAEFDYFQNPIITHSIDWR